MGDRIRAYVTKIDRTAKGPQLILSRIAPEFLMRLFELEVPEIEEGLIEIKAAARDPGMRAKIAVKSNDPRLDPQGTCIGMRGSRVTAVTNELAGERVDIILYSEDPAKFVINALAPAEISSIVVDEEKHAMDVVVDEENLAIAIGRLGQNVRLASELTGWELNLMSVEESQQKHEAESDRLRRLFIDKLDVDEEVADILIGEGFTSLEEVAYVPINEMLEIESFDEDTVNELRSRARNAILTEAIVREESVENVEEALLNLEGMDTEIASTLAQKGITTRDALADLAVDELVELTGMPEQPGAGSHHEGPRALVRGRAGRRAGGRESAAPAVPAWDRTERHAGPRTREKRMAQTTIEQFATELKMPSGVLLEQLAQAGVAGKKEGDKLSEQDKTKLLDYLRKQHGAAGEPKKKITLTRKQTTEIKSCGSTGKARTIQVEVRKKRVFVKRDESEAAPRRRGSAATAPAPRGAPSSRAAELAAREAEEERKGAGADGPAAGGPAEEAGAGHQAQDQEGRGRGRQGRGGGSRSGGKAPRGGGGSRGRGGRGAGREGGDRRHAAPAGGQARREGAAGQAHERHGVPGRGGAPARAQAARRRDRRHRRRPAGGSPRWAAIATTRRAAKARRRCRAPSIRDITVPETITVAELAHKMSVKAAEVIKALMKMGQMVTINQVLDQETAMILAEEMGHKAKAAKLDDLDALIAETQEGARRRSRAAPAGGHRDGPRRPRQDVAARLDPPRARRERRGGRHHAAHRRLPRRDVEGRDHVPRHAGPRGVHRHARARRQGHRHRRAGRRRR